MTIAWALIFPDREIYLFFLIRAGGKILIALTIGLTLLYAAFAGVAAMLPHFLAELLMLVYMGELRRMYLQLEARPPAGAEEARRRQRHPRRLRRAAQGPARRQAAPLAQLISDQP